MTIADEQVIIGAVDDDSSPRGLIVTDDEVIRAWTEETVDDYFAQAEQLTPGLSIPEWWRPTVEGDPHVRRPHMARSGGRPMNSNPYRSPVANRETVASNHLDLGEAQAFALADALDDESSDREPTVVNTEGESIDKYGSSRERRF